jgi:hypothetical protein
MGHGADRTLMAGQLGVVSVYVDRLDYAGESDQQDTQQRQSQGLLFFARFVSKCNQTGRPICERNSRYTTG